MMVRQDQDGWEQDYVRQHGWEHGYAAAMRGETCRCPEGLDAWSFTSGYIEAVAGRQQPGPSPRSAALAE